MVSYDDAKSFSTLLYVSYCFGFFDRRYRIAAKGKYIKSAGLGGFAMWTNGGDYHDILVDAINSAVGNHC